MIEEEKSKTVRVRIEKSDYQNEMLLRKALWLFFFPLFIVIVTFISVKDYLVQMFDLPVDIWDQINESRNEVMIERYGVVDETEKDTN